MVGPYLMLLLSSSQFRKHCQVCCQNCRMCENTMLPSTPSSYMVNGGHEKKGVSEDLSFYDGSQATLISVSPKEQCSNLADFFVF